MTVFSTNVKPIWFNISSNLLRLLGHTKKENTFNPVLPDSQLCSQTWTYLIISLVIVVLAETTVVSYSAVSAVCNYFVLLYGGANIFSLKTCYRRNSNLVFKTDK